MWEVVSLLRQGGTMRHPTMRLKRKPARNSLIYGPVPSRRLGKSLGLDLIPHKACTYDCIYCQLGHTKNKTMEREEFVPTDEVIEQLRDHTASSEIPDYITLSGSGEPTLHERLGKIIAEIKRITDVPVALITNSSLLWNPKVRSECAQADLVLPSLDAGDEGLFTTINRPHSKISFAEMLEGLILFRREYPGPVWLEVMLLYGINTDRASLLMIKEAADRIGPTKIQLNTVTRVPAETSAVRLSETRMQEICEYFGSNAEVIADFQGGFTTSYSRAKRKEILDLLARRSCTVEDIAAGLQSHPHFLAKELARLEKEGQIEKAEWDGKVLYRSLQ